MTNPFARKPSSSYLTQITDGACYLGEVNRATFDTTLKLQAFLFDELQLNVTDILSNQFFYELFSRQDVAEAWLGNAFGPPILRPIIFKGKKFEEVADAMQERETILSLSRPRDLLHYARRLDDAKPQF